MKLLFSESMQASDIGSFKREVAAEVQELLDMCARLEKAAAKLVEVNRRKAKDLMGDVKGVILDAGHDDDAIEDAFDELQTVQENTETAIEKFRTALEDLAEDTYLG